MHIPTICLFALTASTVSASSWFGGTTQDSHSQEPAYFTWTKDQLGRWLEQHHIPLPTPSPSESELRDLVAENWHSTSAWTYDQYTQAQRTFADVRDTAFDKWDESQLREFLLRQGIVAPKGPKEHLVLLAKSHYKAYMDAAKSFSDRASMTAADASKTVEGLVSSASAAVTQAEYDISRTIDRSKDYVYSSWSDSKLKEYLVSKGLLKSDTEKKRDELLAMMESYYHTVVDPIWESWSDSYMHEWLVSHHIIRSEYEKNRDELRGLLHKYYYLPNDRVWSYWSDSELKRWLVDHGIITSQAQVSRGKMVKLVEDSYLQTKDVFWSAWSDNQIRHWLVDNGYLRSDAQVKRDQLVKLANEKYNDSAAKAAAYLTWPDARLRAYLRAHGFDDNRLPTSRPGLLQETRIRWVQTQNRAEAVFFKIKEIVNEGVGRAEDALHSIVSLVSAGWTESKDRLYHRAEGAQETMKRGKDKVKGEL